ncbi:cytochrome P450 [Pseudonocardia eucalypti]|uniref:Cytochrome P450 n=1 Tax=Pseudonocardia eucalypti TaxID=648755 RepID=A0ABP9RCE1_9PSEU|nr:cytochrome P450 [Pseudonocardia eucalypti]
MLDPPPGDGGPPVIGHSWQVVADPPGFCTRRYERYGPISRFTAVGREAVLVVGAEGTEAVLGGRDRAFANGPAWSSFISPFFRRGLMLLDFEEHLRHRGLMQQAFTRDRVEGYLRQLLPILTRDLAEWPVGMSFRVQDAFRELMLRTGVRVFMGGGLGGETDAAVKAFLDCVAATGSSLRFAVPGGRWARGLAGRRLLEELFMERIPVVRTRGGSDLFAVLCRSVTSDGDRFTDEDIVNHMIFLMMAAHDPMTVTLTSMMRFLAERQDWQRQCRAESFARNTAAPTFEDLQRLGSLDLVMRETLRLVPPVPTLFSEAVEDVKVLGFEISQGTMVMMSSYVNHHMPEYWPDPEVFDPLRFAPERREDAAHPYAWLPFGGGVHQCIGMQFAAMQVIAVLDQVLRRYRWKLATGPTPSLNWRGLPIWRDGMPIHLERID